MKKTLTPIAFILVVTLSFSGYLILTDYFTRRACEQSSGRWMTYQNYVQDKQPECNLPTSDAGKKCTDSSQCESRCQAHGGKTGSESVGQCDEWTISNCMREVKDGVIQEHKCLEPIILEH